MSVTAMDHVHIIIIMVICWGGGGYSVQLRSTKQEANLAV